MCPVMNWVIPSTVQYIGSNAFGNRLVGDVVEYLGSWANQSFKFEGNSCVFEGDAFYGVGSSDGLNSAEGDFIPATLVLPMTWRGDVPVNNETAYYGGYFNLDYYDPASEAGPILGSSGVDDDLNAAEEPTVSPKTGDAGSMAGMLAVMMIAAGGVVTTRKRA